MRAETLLRLYPRAWRERYEDEFLAALEGRPLSLQQAIDIVSGAIDARLSADVRRVTAATTGGTMTAKSVFVCETKARYTTRDAAIGAAIMIGVSLLLASLGVTLRREGWRLAGDMALNSAFPISLMLSMPFWLMKGQPWKAQVVIVGGTVLLLAAITYLAVLI